MKKALLTKLMLLLCALIAGSSSMWAATETIYSWDGTGSTTTANETGGTATAVQASGTNIVVGASQKGNYCLKINKGFSNGANYIDITLTGSLSTGDKVTIGAFRTSSTAAVLGVDFGTTATQTLKDDTSVLESNGTPTDFEITVPAAANGGNKIRLYRNSGSTGMWVSKVVVTHESGGSVTTCATPTFSPAEGTYIDAQNVTISCETEGATLYYTTNGDAPTTSSSTIASGSSISVSASCTVKVLAKKEGLTDATASAEYVIPTTTYNTIADLITAAPTEPVILYLTNAQVLGKGDNDMYIKDATGALDLYKLGLTFTAGQILNGKIAVKTYTVYNGMPEITAIGENQIVASAGTLPTPIVLANGAAATLADYGWQLVTVSGNATATNEVDGLLMYKSLMNYSNFMTGVDNLTATGLLIPYQKDNAGDVLPELLPTSIVCHITLSKDMVTYSSNNKLDFSETGLKVYAAKVENGVAKLTEIENAKVTNKKGIILVGTAGQTYNVPFNTGNSTSISENELYGIVAETTVAYSADSKYNYILQNGVFKKATGDKLKAGKAYLTTTYDVTATGAPSLEIVIDGEATGIKDVQRSTFNVNGYYDLQGRKVVQPTKGLYIVNGKKVVIK